MKVVNEKADDWDSHLASVIFGYRVNKQGSTKISPFELLYGVRPRLPVDLNGDVSDEGDDQGERDAAVSQRVVDLAETVTGLRTQAGDNIKDAQRKQKKRYDMKHSDPAYSVGQLVLKLNRRKETRMGGKLEKRFTGPYTIAEVMGTGVYRLKDGEAIMKQVVNACNLKPFIAPCSPESMSPAQSPSSTNSVMTSPETSQSVTVVEDIPDIDTTLPQPWLPALKLTMEDKELILSSDGWLTDNIIDAVNKLVHQLLGSDGNQSTLMAQAPAGFDEVVTESVQVLHDDSHWVASACIGNEIFVADSLGVKTISKYVATQLRQQFSRMIDVQSGKLPVSLVVSPHQPNGCDCGLYASAAAFEWVMGNPTLPIQWDVAAMRPHLVACLERGEAASFASQQATVRRKGRKPQPIKLNI